MIGWGVAFKAVGGFLKGLPREVWIGLGCIFALWYAYHSGYKNCEKDQAAKAVKVVEKIVYKQGKVTERVVTKFQDRIVKVRVAGETIIKEVPVYVTPENDAACIINNGFVSLWNRANQGTIPEAASAIDGAPSEVRLSEVASQHGAEALVCRETETKLEALQDWVREQERIN